MAESRPWEQLEGEPEAAYTRFLFYMGLGPLRSLEKAYTQYRALSTERVEKGEERLSAPGQWQRDSVKYRWGERAGAWDIEGLVRHAEGAVIKRMAAMDLVAGETLEALTNGRGKIKYWKDIIAGLDLLGRLIPAEATAALYADRATWNEAPEANDEEPDEDEE